jgi:hypothetical protein
MIQVYEAVCNRPRALLDYLPIALAKVDDRHHEYLSKLPVLCWTVIKQHDRQYAECVDRKGNRESLHRTVWQIENGPIPIGYEVTLYNGNGLDCTINNLILKTAKQRRQGAKKSVVSQRSSKYIGVVARGERWAASIDDITLGTFDDEHCAAFAFNIAASELRGFHAVLNEIPDGTISTQEMTLIHIQILRKLGWK